MRRRRTIHVIGHAHEEEEEDTCHRTRMRGRRRIHVIGHAYEEVPR